jgi:ABC-type nitrate/sulfonate/bicarbonate transport system permease component
MKNILKNYLQKKSISQISLYLVFILLTWLILSLIYPDGLFSLIRLNKLSMITLGSESLSIFSAFLKSMKVIIMCLFFGITIGYFVGILMFNFSIVNKILYHPFNALKSIPVTVLLPVFFGIFGLDGYLIPLLSLPLITILSVNICDACGLSNKSRNESIRLIGIGKINLFKHILFWETLETLFSTLKILLSFIIALVIAFDYFIEDIQGLGYYIRKSYYMGNQSFMYLGIIVVGLISILILKSTYYFERKLIKWKISL